MILPVLVRSLVAGPLEIDAGEMPVSEQLVQAVLNGQAILVQHILAEHDFIADTLRCICQQPTGHSGMHRLNTVASTPSFS